MNMRIDCYQKNTVGDDYVVGDIHGYFSKLKTQLDKIGFNYEKDRLFSVGDLIDRGPESDSIFEWLYYSWFHPVRGNHEEMALWWVDDKNCESLKKWYASNGGSWNIANTINERIAVADAIRDLPLAIELETNKGKIGIIHANLPRKDWENFKELCLNISTQGEKDNLLNSCLWNRSSYENKDTRVINGVDYLIVGHTPMTNGIVILGNTVYIDSNAWANREVDFNIIKVNDL